MSRVVRRYRVGEAASVVKEKAIVEKGMLAGLLEESKVPLPRELSLGCSMPRSIDGRLLCKGCVSVWQPITSTDTDLPRPSVVIIFRQAYCVLSVSIGNI